MSANDIRAGRAYVEVGVHDSALTRGLREAQNKLAAFGTAVRTLGKQMMLAGGGIVAPLVGAAKLFADAGSAVHDMGQRVGIGAEALTSLSYAATQSGVDMESLEGALRKMQKAIGAAAGGSQGATESLSKLGLSVSELMGLSPDQQFKAIGDSLSRIADPTLRAAMAMEVFGKTGTSVLPLFKDGAAGLAALEARAKSLGAVLSTQAVAAADELGDSLDDVKAAAGGATNAIGAALAPVLTQYANTMARVLATASAWVQQNRDLVVTALKAGGVIAGLGGAFLALGTVANAVSFAIGGLVKALQIYSLVAKAAAAATALLNGPMLGAKAATLVAAAAANPLIVAVAAIGAALAALCVVLAVTKSRADALTDSMRQLRQAGDEQRTADMGQMQQLQQLAAQHNLTRAQMQQAAGIVSELQSRYGKLGITLDYARGSIYGAGDAFARLADAMKKVAEADVNREIDETRKNIAKLTGQIDEATRKPMVPWQAIRGDTARIENVNELGAQRDAQQRQLDQLMSRRRALHAGDRAALTGTGPAAGIGAEDVAGPGGKAAQDRMADRMHRIHELQIEDMQNANARAVALVNERYNEEARKAREAGATKEELAAIEAARALEVTHLQTRQMTEANERAVQQTYELQTLKNGAIEDEHQRELAAIETRFRLERALAQLRGDAAGETAAAEIRAGQIDLENARQALRVKEQAARVSTGNQGIAYEVADLTLQQQFRGKELKLAQIELARERELEAARAEGLNEDLVNAKYDAMRKLTLAETEVGQVAGTFNGRYASQIFGTSIGGNAVPERNGPHLVDIKGLLRDIRRNTQPICAT